MTINHKELELALAKLRDVEAMPFTVILPPRVRNLIQEAAEAHLATLPEPMRKALVCDIHFVTYSKTAADYCGYMKPCHHTISCFELNGFGLIESKLKTLHEDGMNDIRVENIRQIDVPA